MSSSGTSGVTDQSPEEFNPEQQIAREDYAGHDMPDHEPSVPVPDPGVEEHLQRWTDVDQAATAVAALLQDTAIAHRLATGGRLAVEQFYNWARVAKDLRRLGDEVTAAGQVPER